MENFRRFYILVTKAFAVGPYLVPPCPEAVVSHKHCVVLLVFWRMISINLPLTPELRSLVMTTEWGMLFSIALAMTRHISCERNILPLIEVEILDA